MTVRVKVIFDTSEWGKNSKAWEVFGGFCEPGQAYFFIPCETMEDIEKALDNVYGLGHKAEVIYG